MKVCSGCTETKSKTEFHVRKSAKDGLSSACKLCRSLAEKEYRAKNSNKLSQKKHTYYSKNRERILKDKKVYNNQNAHSRKIYMNDWYNGHKDDPEFRAKRTKYTQQWRTRGNNALILNIRSRLNKAIAKDQRTGSAVRDLGCSIEEFKIYIASKFQPRMSWGNYGRDGWHLDHIMPLSKFDLNDPKQVKKAVHYTNLQPMWAEDNLKKGNQLPTVILVIGCFGVGKTWVTSQLTEKFYVYHYDTHKPHEIPFTNPPDFKKPLLYDLPIKTITLINTLKPKVNLRVVAIEDSIELIKLRIENRGKNYEHQNIQRRIKRIRALASKHAEFTGTSDEVLSYLKTLHYIK